MNGRRVKELKREVAALKGEVPNLTKQGFRRLKKKYSADPTIDVKRCIVKMAQEDFARIWENLDDAGRAQFLQHVGPPAASSSGS